MQSDPMSGFVIVNYEDNPLHQMEKNIATIIEKCPSINNIATCYMQWFIPKFGNSFAELIQQRQLVCVGIHSFAISESLNNLVEEITPHLYELIPQMNYIMDHTEDIDNAFANIDTVDIPDSIVMLQWYTIIVLCREFCEWKYDDLADPMTAFPNISSTLPSLVKQTLTNVIMKYIYEMSDRLARYAP
jgi:hypothetical protein